MRATELPKETAMKVINDITKMNHGKDFWLLSNIPPIAAFSPVEDMEDANQIDQFYLG